MDEAVALAYQLLRAQQEWKNSKSGLVYQHILPYPTAYAPWLDDAEFMAVYNSIKPLTLVDVYRCYELWSMAKQLGNVEGNVLEVGVWRGGTAAILAQALKTAAPEKMLYLADTFTGVVKSGQNDTHYTDHEHADTSVDLVRQLMKAISFDSYAILQGIFPDENQDKVQGPIALLHCDVDVYQSAKDVFYWCLPHLKVGSTVVFDDYGCMYTGGVTKLCNELRALTDFRFVYNLNGHAIFVKIR